MSSDYGLSQSFKFAFSGIKAALRREPNFRIHITISVLSLFIAFILGFSAIEWLILVMTITFVLVLELVNTALEEIVNLLSPDLKLKAKIAKDVSASAVLLSAIVAIIVGVALFVPKLAALFSV